MSQKKFGFWKIPEPRSMQDQRSINIFLSKRDTCVICNCAMEIPFPIDFPNDFKLCCGCSNLLRSWAYISPDYKKEVLDPAIKEILDERYKKFQYTRGEEKHGT